MQTLLQYALKKNDDEIVEAYAEWAKLILQQTPEPSIFAGLSLALHYRGDYSQSYEVLRRALAIYPTNGVVLTAQKSLARKDQDAGLPVGVP